MRWVLGLFALPTLGAQFTSVPYAGNSGPLFSIETVNQPRPGQYRSIRDVDFRKLAGPRGKRLKNGRYEHTEREGKFVLQFESVALEHVYYLNQAYALVLYRLVEGGGSTNNMGTAVIFGLSHRRLTAVQRITWDVDASRSEKIPRLYSFDPGRNTVTILSSHYIPGDAHCCISAVDVVTLAWKDSHFEKVSLTTELSEYGRTQGKKLP